MKNRFCAMLDVSRNGVLKVEKVKEFIDVISKMGYNALMLYTEDTYEVKNEPLFGYLRGAYTASEIKEIDAYATQKGIELIPCIQTLAHLNGIFRWYEYAKINDTDDILLVGDERTYQLIENMFLTLAENFSSRTVLVGLDEAHMVGRGKYRDINGNEPSYDVMCKHLDKVSKIAKKHGFEILMWSDMFVRIANGGEYYADKLVPESVAKRVPKNTVPVCWDYYHVKEEDYEKFFNLHGAFKEVWFAGGTWCWCGFLPCLNFALNTTRAAMNVCRKRKVNNIIMTLWGDDGRECSCFTSLPVLYYAIETYKGNTDIEKIKKGFKQITGEDFDAFMTLEHPNFYNESESGIDNPTKYMLYNDPFFGVFDFNVVGGEREFYQKAAAKLERAEKKSKAYRHIFRFEKDLCRALSVKCDLGVRTRKAYQEKDLDGLREIVKDYSLAIRYVKKFLASFEEVWELENKPNGFEVQQIRLGGLIQRLVYCKNKIVRYLDGKIEDIPELERALIDAYGLKNKKESGFAALSQWILNATVNIV